MANPKDTYNGNGSQTLFQFTFPYLSTSDIKVTVDGAATTAYTFASATEIEFTTGNEPPTGVDNVVIYRDTAYDSTAATFYPGSSIRAQDLNNNFTQTLYVNQESDMNAAQALENSRVLESGDYVSAIAKAEAAVVTSDAANATAGIASAAASSAVVTAGLADGKADTAIQDSATALSQSQDTSNPPVAAITIANEALSNSRNTATPPVSAISIATDAATDAAEALSNSRNTASPPVSAISIATDAAQDAATALSNSRNTASPPVSAIDIAVAADAIADAAKLATDTYVHDGTSLKGDGISPNPQGVKYAVDKVNDWIVNGDGQGSNQQGVPYAVAVAESAASSVAQSAIYTVVANFAALPALTDASLSAEGASPYYQVNDSTLIQDETEVTGEPANFIGDDELAVKLKANITASPKVWEWQEYYATDPETRYRKKLIVENLITISETYTIGTGNNAHSVGPVTLSHNGTPLLYNPENHATAPYVATNATAAGNTVTIPENSTWLIN